MFWIIYFYHWLSIWLIFKVNIITIHMRPPVMFNFLLQLWGYFFFLFYFFVDNIYQIFCKCVGLIIYHLNFVKLPHTFHLRRYLIIKVNCTLAWAFNFSCFFHHSFIKYVKLSFGIFLLHFTVGFCYGVLETFAVGVKLLEYNL